jgi:hypothetical protein
MQDAAVVIGAVSALALVASLLFLARQTRAAAQESQLSNQIAGIQARSRVYESIDRILYRILDYPELWAHFYEGAAVPAVGDAGTPPLLRERVLTLAELFVDAIENGIDVARSVGPAASFQTPMEDYAAAIVSTSPAILLLVEERPGWWPNVEDWLAGRRDGTDPAIPPATVAPPTPTSAGHA